MRERERERERFSDFVRHWKLRRIHPIITPWGNSGAVPELVLILRATVPLQPATCTT